MQSDGKRQEQNEQTTEVKKLLQGKDFLLEVEDRQWRTKVAESIQSLGGRIIDSFDDHKPVVVVSDHHLAARLEKEKHLNDVSERMLKMMPALLREAVKKKIKVRTPQTFIRHINNYNMSKKTPSMSTSNSTTRGRPQIGRERSLQIEKTQPVPSTSSRPGSAGMRLKEERAFLRIDLPGKKPDVRFVDRTAFDTVYAGCDTGHSVFKIAEPALAERRQRDFELFKKGLYEPTKKNFKLDEPDNYCSFCSKTVTGDKKEHEKTDEHRQKLKTQGRASALERILLNAKLRKTQQENFEKRKAAVSRERQAMREIAKRATVEYEYGENELRANWSTLKPNIVPETSRKPIEVSPRRRQKRIRLSPSRGDGPLLL